ncbi:hypothetical protein IKD98_03190 [Candidatus Saccharibacteria bacterium]|nr:hypothetical protein [Candidatus Saccharibacteria bacterium]
MIKVFYGDDRVRAKKAISEFLGDDYEIIDATDLAPNDLPNIFLGQTLFDDTRKILLRDFFTNSSVASELPNYLNTPHDIAIFDLKIDKRKESYKAVKDQIKFTEFALPPSPNFRLAFDIYKIAKHDGKKAVSQLAKIKSEEDPMMFLGLLASQALKDFDAKQGIKEKRALKALARTDLQTKSTSIDPWLLIESFLLEVSHL